MLKGVAMINDKRTILVGLDGPAMDTLLKGVTAFVVNVEDMEELKDEAPEQIVVLYAPTNADLTELFAAHLKTGVTFQRSGKDGD